MLTRDFKWKMKALDSESGAFSGLASPYGDPADLQGDVVAPGAYAQSIKQQPAAGYPVLWNHDAGQPVGVGRIADSPAGLLIDGKLFLEDPAAQRAHVHMKGGSVRGISIGFLPPKGDKVERRNDGARILKEVHLVELSLVAVPAAPRAQITEVKSLGDVQQYLQSIRTADSAMLDELAEINLELKRLLTAQEPTAPDNADVLCQLRELATAMKKLSFAA
jgi:HK97 family phage prohead protease